ncbi:MULTISPECIES: flagellar transcriptional regulator FlhD [Pseudoduganella]|uniref:Flagellar transcriptional regulator FlhD n=1 Tax=Pseudoduganella lutea TaxID=321985 RepID=A0A4P6L5Z0_9BURK|nr:MULTISPECIES: flagellar transcriptional regulator FlhD [Pseudoduganella]QBE66272.1 hypothetical protein EWM63_27565 [Pseudoduganella lutea]WBS00176.1 flagellar transcriptional regulator FlhD [Pseudoduganella sp. SL102]
MDNAPHLSDVQQLNLDYLLIVQAALKQDRLTASYTFHLDPDSAAILPTMSVRELSTLAQSVTQESLCRPIANLAALLKAPRSLAGMLCTAGVGQNAAGMPAGQTNTATF